MTFSQCWNCSPNAFFAVNSCKFSPAVAALPWQVKQYCFSVAFATGGLGEEVCAERAGRIETLATTTQLRKEERRTEAAWRRVDEQVITFNKDTPKELRQS